MTKTQRIEKLLQEIAALNHFDLDTPGVHRNKARAAARDLLMNVDTLEVDFGVSGLMLPG